MATFLLLFLFCWGYVLTQEGCLTRLNVRNVALNAPVCQSSVYAGGNPKRAVDGNRNSHYSQGSCMHTGYDNPAWWKVDLRECHKIGKINIVNREDCCGERLLGAEIRIGNSNNYAMNALCTTVLDLSFYTFCCNGMEGRYVFIVVPGRTEYLSLCEVEVYGVPVVDNSICMTDKGEESLE